MKRYTVAQVGAGGRGKIHANAFLELTERFELVGLCDLDQDKLRTYAKQKNLADDVLYDDADKMLAATNPDVFCFVTQPDVRLSMVELAAEYGVKGLVFEKPMATSLREAWDSTRLCREHNIKAVVSHQQKYLTSLQKVKQLVDAGEVGDVIEVNATCQAWLSQIGTHFMDYILWVNNGSKAKWAVGHVHGKELLSDHHPSPNYTMGHVEFENGVRSFFEFGKLSASHQGTVLAGQPADRARHARVRMGRHRRTLECLHQIVTRRNDWRTGRRVGDPGAYEAPATFLEGLRRLAGRRQQNPSLQYRHRVPRVRNSRGSVYQRHGRRSSGSASRPVPM